jgi:hypothetical protein
MLRTITLIAMLVGVSAGSAQETRVYEHRLVPIKNPGPLLADHPEFVEPIRNASRYEAPILVDDRDGDLEVRAWRFSYNLRGIVEMPNRLSARATAVIVVHPWGIDDGQGWQTPEPAGACDFCTPAKNALAGRHTRDIINPFVASHRSKVGAVVYSLRGDADPIRMKRYRTIVGRPSDAERKAAAAAMDKALKNFSYKGQSLPAQVTLAPQRPVADYFRQVPGLDAGPRYNGAGFWELPIPVTSDLEVAADDVVVYDNQGYPALRDFLKKEGIRHVLLAGYATDMCFAATTAGYRNLDKDFNVFLVGDATLATFPANDTPRFATNAAIAFASIDHLVTQMSWIRSRPVAGQP